jgi:hypothetical protein
MLSQKLGDAACTGKKSFVQSSSFAAGQCHVVIQSGQDITIVFFVNGNDVANQFMVAAAHDKSILFALAPCSSRTRAICA